MFEVTDENEPEYREALNKILQEADRLDRFFTTAKYASDVQVAGLRQHLDRARSAARKLEAEVTKRNIISASKNVSAVPDAHLIDDEVLAPSSEKIQSAYEGFNTDLVDYDLFNELEDAYLRLKAEGELPEIES